MIKYLFEKSFSIVSILPVMFGADSFSKHGFNVWYFVWCAVAILIMTWESNLAERKGW